MEYSYKPTTHGRAAMAACMDLEKPLKITRVAFGSGRVADDMHLADVHELLSYVSDGAVSERRHEHDRFFLTIQYANVKHKDVKMFLLTEFIVYVEDPETGEDTDLLYGTLGDYRQPVPAYNPAYPPSVFNFPLEIIISDEINVNIAAPAGLVTHEELNRAIDRIKNESDNSVAEVVERQLIAHNQTPDAHMDIRQSVENLKQNIGQYLGGGVVRSEQLDITIPAAGWEPDTDTGGAYPFRRDIPHAKITEEAVPFLTVLPASTEAAGACNLCPAANTVPGALRVYAKSVPASDLSASLVLLRDVRGKAEITIPVTGWTDDGDTGGEYPLHIDIADDAITEELTPLLTILPESLKTAGMCCMSPTARTLDGLLRVYAKFVPDKPIKARLTLLGGSQGGSGGGYTLPPASAYTLGGVKVRQGSGLTVDSGGNLAIDGAEAGSVEKLFGSNAGNSVE